MRRVTALPLICWWPPVWARLAIDRTKGDPNPSVARVPEDQSAKGFAGLWPLISSNRSIVDVLRLDPPALPGVRVDEDAVARLAGDSESNSVATCMFC